MKPSIHRKPAVGESLGRRLHRSDLMCQRANEQNGLVLFGHDDPIVRHGYVVSTLPFRVVNTQFAPTEWFGFAMKEVDEGNCAMFNIALPIVCVPMEKIAVIAGGDLRLDSCDVERVMAEPFQYTGKRFSQTVHDDLTMRP